MPTDAVARTGPTDFSALRRNLLDRDAHSTDQNRQHSVVFERTCAANPCVLYRLRALRYGQCAYVIVSGLSDMTVDDMARCLRLAIQSYAVILCTIDYPGVPLWLSKESVRRGVLDRKFYQKLERLGVVSLLLRYVRLNAVSCSPAHQECAI